MDTVPNDKVNQMIQMNQTLKKTLTISFMDL